MLPRGLIKEHFQILVVLLRCFDVFAIFIAGYVAYLNKFGDLNLPRFYLPALAFAMLLTAVVFQFFHIYGSVRAKSLRSYIGGLIQAISMVFVILAGSAFMTKSGDLYSREWFGLWVGWSVVLLIIFRGTLLLLLRLMRLYGLNERRVIVIGTGEAVTKLVHTVQESLWTGFHVVTIFDDFAEDQSKTIGAIPVLKTPEDLSQYFIGAEMNVDEVWLAFPLRAEDRVKSILYALRHHPITKRLVLDFFGLDVLNHSVMDLAGLPVLNICSTPMVGMNRLIKAFEDRIIASIILLLISPLLLAIATAVKLSSPGPIFYRQKRVGWNGKEFEMLKFRTMPVDAESKTGPVWARKDEDRATKVGAFLRRTSLDELPQFINVLQGNMSIVGPRPERMHFVDQFKDQIPRYMQKHMMKAGITGWAQVNGWRGNTSLEKRIEYDLYYIENWSLFFDLKIIFLTMFRGFVNKNAY